MAGIGFALRKLLHRDDLSGVAGGMVRSAVLSTGPWLFTVLGLAGIDFLGPLLVSRNELSEFQILIFYNFAFSLLLSGPLLTVVTRFLSDLVYARRAEEAMGLMLGSFAVLFCMQALVVIPFYFGFVRVSFATRVFACMNFFLISGIWLVHVFLTTLHNDRSVAASFILGCLTAFAAAMALARAHSTAGMLLGFNLGLALLLFSLMARVLAEYPASVRSPFAFLGTFSRHWRLAVGGLAYNAAIWADKWVMWAAPESMRLACGLVSFTHYDSAMFLAYLSIVPAIALFVIQVETRFYEAYLRYLRDIREHAPWPVIEQNEREILHSIFAGGRQILIWQGLVTAVFLVTAPLLLETLGVAYIELGIFRLGLLGAFFHALLLFLLILLSYFELYREALFLQLLFLAANAGLSAVSMRLGFAWYGSGYALASVISFGAAAVVTFRLLPTVAFETFVRRNAAIHDPVPPV